MGNLAFYKRKLRVWFGLVKSTGIGAGFGENIFIILTIPMLIYKSLILPKKKPLKFL